MAICATILCSVVYAVKFGLCVCIVYVVLITQDAVMIYTPKLWPKQL